MIRTKNGNDSWIAGVMAASAVLLVAALGFMLLYPPPSKDKVIADHKATVRKQTDDMAKSKAQTAEIEAAISKNLWQTSLEGMGPQMLAKINKLAMADKVKLSSFRPQRTVDVDGLTQVPYLLTIDGSFPNIVSFVRDIEQPETKMAVMQTQMNAVDGSSDKVSATIGIVAYMQTGGSNG